MNNILKEYIEIIIKEENENESQYTFGDLEDAIKVYIDSKGKKEKILKNKKIGKQVAKLALDFIPLAGAAANTAELFGSLMTVKDENRPKSFLSDFDLDDKTSKIADNNIEAAFLQHLLLFLDKKDKNSTIKNFDMTKEFNNFLEKNYERKIIG